MSDLKDEVTPKNFYLNRRTFLKTSIYAATTAGTTLAYRHFRPLKKEPGGETSQVEAPEATAYKSIIGYNNFYEFSTDKEEVAGAAAGWKFQDWNLEIGGLVENPYRLSLSEILNFETEERIYRFRCVEGWSMVVPWSGVALEKLIEKAKPQSSATHVAFETYFNASEMPRARWAGIPFPYVEGLRLDEALNPLTFIATGIYNKKLPNQNGAPVRLVVPWKYGFKSIKSIVKINLTDKEPPTTWNIANPNEYGFFSNVNPEVDHPRWSQKQERRLGELRLRDTLKFNGYEKEVAHLYSGMDLRKYF